MTFDRNELMWNFLLVLRELIANRFCYIYDWGGRELGGWWGGGMGELGEKKPYQ